MTDLSVAYCTRCGRTGTDIGQCGNFVTPCPEPAYADGKKVAVLTCGPCGKTLAVPTAQIMQGRGAISRATCSRDTCAAVMVLPEVAPAVAPAAPNLSAEDTPEVVSLKAQLAGQKKAAQGYKQQRDEARKAGEAEAAKVDQLQKDSDFLGALRAAGVDNWEGYSEAHKILDEE